VRQLDDEIWVEEAPLRYYVEMGRRMTVVRVRERELLVHSPAPLDERLQAELAELGQVRYVVPASNLHGHLFMEQYARAYRPPAELFAAPGLVRKRGDLFFDHSLGERPDPRWEGALDQALFRGHKRLEEVLFFHRPSRSLLVGDTFFNIGPEASLLTRLWAWGPRLRRRAGPTPLFRMAVRDRQAARSSLERVLAWPFERIVVGHGEIVESGGREAFREAWSWVEQ
jgi:Domain of unknown function (DUF4336)